jgi:23S rRNA G2445 N2-methylase RlmL
MQIGGDPDLAGEMWVRPNPEAEDVGDIFSYALTVGYPAFGPGGTEAVSRVCEPVRQRREETGKWQGSFEQLRACLFFEQRRYHHFGNEPDGEALEVIKRLHKALCEQWDLETEFIPHRAKKDPRDLKILDPACGSGHFLLYAFDLLETIYEEAWEDEDVPPFTETSSRLRDDYATIEDMRVALPDLILRHNLHGIDIDPRACQIAALALWLRAQRSYQRLGLKGADRPQITKTNIVVAEPMPGERDMLHEFCAGLRWNTLANIVRAVFEKMKLAGEAGSLLKIEEDIRDLIKLAQQERRAEIERARDKKGNDLLFTQSDMDKIAGEKQQRLFDATDMTDEELWQEMESHVLSALERYAEKATNGHTASRRLFAEDAERGFAFIELCVQWYDVALMNPPFGEPASASKPYITRCYARSKHDLACGFVDRWIARCLHQGRLGAITTRTVFFLSSSARWREETMLKENHVDVFADLGYGVLDAMVETAAYCLVSGQLQRG